VLLGVYCHFCAETTGFAGRYYGSNENIGPRVIFVNKDGGKGPAKNVPRSRCKCSNRFKGYCKSCEGEGFVDDGALGRSPDFSEFGGDKGLDPGWSNNTDPIRSVLGGTSGGGVSTSDSGYGGDHSNAPQMTSDGQQY